MSNEIAGSMLPVMYFPAMIVSLYSTVELWFILFIVPIVGSFMGVYIAISMNHEDECEENTIVDDVIFEHSQIKKESVIYKL